MPTQAKSVWDDNIQVEEAKTAKKIPTRTGGALWRPCLIGLSLGILITGVVLTAIVVMFIQDSQKTTSTTTTTSSSSTSTSSTSTTTTSTSTTTTTTTTTTTRTTSTTSTSSTSTTSRTTTTTTTSTTSTTSSPLPAQCFSYATNADSTRNFAYTATIGCDSGLFGGGTWVRFVSPAGTVIPSSAQSTYACGTHATGWYNGPYPSSPGTTTAGTVCYHWSGNTCYWSSAISITHCSTFYVFLLVDPPACSLRYCTA